MSEIEWSRLKASEIKALAARNAIVIVPIGATEQHGPHLPLSTDTDIALALCHGLASRRAPGPAPAFRPGPAVLAVRGPAGPPSLPGRGAPRRTAHHRRADHRRPPP